MATSTTISPDLRQSFDTRQVSKPDLTKALDDGDKAAAKAFGPFKRDISWHGQVMDVTWVPASPWLSGFSNDLDTARNEINEKPMSITGAGYLGSTIKDRIAATKANANKVQTDIVSSLDQMDETIASGAKIAKSIQDEAAALQADLGQISNGAPE